jgi:hypothetical protein
MRRGGLRRSVGRLGNTGGIRQPTTPEPSSIGNHDGFPCIGIAAGLVPPVRTSHRLGASLHARPVRGHTTVSVQRLGATRLPAERRVSGESEQQEDERHDEGQCNHDQMHEGAPPERFPQSQAESFAPGWPARGSRFAAEADQPFMQLTGWDHHAYGIA